MKLNLSSSLEDYLEAIFELIKAKGKSRVVDISEKLSVKKPSVTAALRKLAEKKLISYEPYQPIALTEQGRKIAVNIANKHKVIKNFLTNVLAVDNQKADDIACSMEHLLNEEIIDKVVAFEKFLDRCPNFEYKWIENKGFYCNIEEENRCEHCSDDCKNDNKKNKSKENYVRTLNETQTGDMVEVIEISTNSTVKKRLVEMGISKGTIIRLEKIAPMNDPIDIVVKGYHLSIRREEAKNIKIKKQ